MAKHVIEYDGIEYDSLPEACFAAWVTEAFEKNILSDWRRQDVYAMTPKYEYTEYKQLKTKIKQVQKTLLLPSTYTSDFALVSNVELKGLHKVQSFSDKRHIYVIDVKGESNNTNAKGLFSLKQKMMMFTNGIYVNKVIPGKFFCDNGWPERLPEQCYMQSGGLYAWLRKYNDKCSKTIGETYVY